MKRLLLDPVLTYGEGVLLEECFKLCKVRPRCDDGVRSGLTPLKVGCMTQY